MFFSYSKIKKSERFSTKERKLAKEVLVPIRERRNSSRCEREKELKGKQSHQFS